MRSEASFPALEWATVSRAHPSETVSGDFAVVAGDDECLTVAVIDGLGRGDEAARAARLARDAVADSGAAHPLQIAERCHEALTGSRGAALAVGSISTSTATLTWLGVGNVHGRLLRPHARFHGANQRSLRVFRGVLGLNHSRAFATDVAVRRGDVVIFASDGIAAAFADALDVSGSPERIARRIVRNHWNRADDAVIAVVRYLATTA